MSLQPLCLSDLSSRIDRYLSGKSSTTCSYGPLALPPHVDISCTLPGCFGDALQSSHRCFYSWPVFPGWSVCLCVCVCVCVCVCACTCVCRVRGSVWNTHSTIAIRRILRLIFYVAEIQWQLNSQPLPSLRWNLAHLVKKGKIPRTGVTTFGRLLRHREYPLLKLAPDSGCCSYS